MRQARTCWPVLVKKAQDAVNDAQTTSTGSKSKRPKCL